MTVREFEAYTAGTHLWVFYEAFETVDEVCAVEWIATDAHHCRLP